MAKIKLTKTELKAQTDALKRFQRFLPMLQLKKQQLQAEIALITARIEEVTSQEESEQRRIHAWVSLFSDASYDPAALVTLDRVVTGTSNIAGVSIPVFKSIQITPARLDLFASPPWLDTAIAAVTHILSVKAERTVLERQRELVTVELNMTAQRVNLFEKIKIPECRENIRIIKIAIGDAQTASVSRGKIAKGRNRKESPHKEDAA